MHETTRRRGGRLGFIALCLLPTVVVLAWGAAWNSRRHVDVLERQLEQALGWRVAVHRLSHPRPGVLLLDEVELFDPETAEVIGRSRLIEARSSADSLHITAQQPEISAAHLDRLRQWNARRMRRELSIHPATIEFEAREVTIRRTLAGTPDATTPGHTLTDVAVRMEADAQHDETSLLFRVAGIEMKEPATLQVTRDREASPPTTQVWLRSEAVPLPLAVIVPWMELDQDLGPMASYCGSVRAMEAGDGWEGELAGKLTGVDLQRAIAGRFGVELSGTAQLAIEGAKFRRGRLIEAAGVLSAGPGVVGQRFLLSASESLQMTAGYPTTEPTQEYQSLYVGFVAGPQGLILHGREADGAVMTAADHLLLTTHQVEPLPVQALVRTLVPANEVQVPAGPETEWLIGRLPLAPLVRPPSPDGTQPPVEARLRLGGVRRE